MRVCIIDDDDTNLMLAGRIVERISPDLTIEKFLDPAAALARCAEAMPDLVLVDYMMPGIDGLEVLRRLRAMPGSQYLPIVMLTSLNERSIRKQALELGATDFIAKPIETGEVRARLGNLLDLRRSQLLLADQNLRLASEVTKATQTVTEREEELILRLCRAAEFRDPETGAHITRIAHFSRLIASALGLAEEECDLIQRASPMHDIGKLGIPDGILLKPGPLDGDERTIMQRHAQIGHSILAGSDSRLIRLGAEIALSHHERFDGAGYPSGLRGSDIPQAGRVVAVADVFDALTSERPYKKPWTVERARAFVQENRGTHFDPRCVDAFLAAWPEVLRIRETFEDPPPDDDPAEILSLDRGRPAPRSPRPSATSLFSSLRSMAGWAEVRPAV